MRQLPKISVIVPVYMAEKYLHRCVDSILSQTFTDFELLLIDDGSPDKSGEICDRYALQDTRIRVFHKPNGGVSSARQCGIDNAIGEYTIHADPDDWVEPDMLEELYKKADAERVGMVICDFFQESNGKQKYISQQPQSIQSESIIRQLLFQQLHGSCCNKLIKRAYYKKWSINFPKNLDYSEDTFFCICLLSHDCSVAYLNKAFYHYDVSINTNSLLRTNPTRLLSGMQLFLKRISDVLDVKVYKEELSYQYAGLFILSMRSCVYTTMELHTVFCELNHTYNIRANIHGLWSILTFLSVNLRLYSFIKFIIINRKKIYRFFK